MFDEYDSMMLMTKDWLERLLFIVQDLPIESKLTIIFGEKFDRKWMEDNGKFFHVCLQ